MKVLVALYVFATMCLASSAIATEALSLRGEGRIKYLGFIDVYDAALYTETSDFNVDVLNPEISKCLRLEYMVDLSPKDFIKAANTVLKRQHPPEALDRIAAELSLLHNSYLPVKEGDNYQLCYDGRKKVTTLQLNQQELVAIESADLSSFYFGMWLGAKEPIDEKLRNSLLYGQN